MTPSRIAPGVASSLPQDAAIPASAAVAEPGFEAELSLALSGQPLAVKATAEEPATGETPTVATDPGLQNLPPVLPWLPTIAANFSTPADAGVELAAAKGVPGAADASASAASAVPVAQLQAGTAVPEIAAASQPGQPTPVSASQPLFEASAAAALQAASGSGPSDSGQALARAPVQDLHPAAPALTPVQADPASSQPALEAAEPSSSAQVAPKATESAQQPSVNLAQSQANAAPASEAAPVTTKALQPEQGAEPQVQAAPAAASASLATVQDTANDRAANSPVASLTLVSSPYAQTASQTQGQPAAAQTLQAAAAIEGRGTGIQTVTEPAQSAAAQNNPATTVAAAHPAQPQTSSDPSSEGLETAESVSHDGPRLGIEDGAEFELPALKAATDAKAPGSTGATASTPPSVDAPSPALNLSTAPSGSASSVFTSTPSQPTTPAAVDVSLPIKPHWVSLEGGAVQVEILRMARDGGGQVTLELTPPDQGRYRLDLRIDDLGQATLVVDGASESTRTRLEMGETALREQFSQLGLQLNLQLRSSQSDQYHPSDLPSATASSQEGPSSAESAAPSRRPTALDLDRGLVRLYA